MCEIIVINRGEKEISTPKQFFDHFGFWPETEFDAPQDWKEECLCPCDIDRTFDKHKIPFKTYAGDYFVGMLEEVKGDEE